MLVIGLVIVAIGFLLAQTKAKSGNWPVVIQCIGWIVVLYFGIKALVATHGVTLP